MFRMLVVFGFLLPTHSLILDLTRTSDNRTVSGRGRWWQGGHADTHLDAPCRYGGKYCAETLPLERLFELPVMVLDSEDGMVSVSDLRHWEKHNGRPPKNGVLIVRSGQGMTADAADWAARNMHVVAVGTDGPSIGPEAVHKVLARNHAYAIEGLTQLDAMPHKGAKLYVFPTKVKDSRSAPVRVMALVKGAASQVGPCFVALILTAISAFLLV